MNIKDAPFRFVSKLFKGEKTLDFTQDKQSIYYERPVVVYPDRQFITGEKPRSDLHLSDPRYSQALDVLVIGCVDIIPVYQGRMLLGLRSWHPQPNWWCFGGRMQKGEIYQIAAARNVQRELFHNLNEFEINPNRFVLVGVYNLIWSKRAQEPVDNGCHMISITMMLSLSKSEVASLKPNEEYRETRWMQPDEIIHSSDRYHPCLVQIAEDLTHLISCTEAVSSE